MVACFLVNITECCIIYTKKMRIFWGGRDKITKKFHTFYRNVCYNNKARMKICVFICGKGVPYE